MDNDSFIVRSHNILLDTEYGDWIAEIKRRFRTTQVKAAVKVNAEALQFNWQLGRDLVIRKAEEKWGKGIVEQLSLDLRDAFPGVKGFSARNLWFMKQWYSFYASDTESAARLAALDNELDSDSKKLKQVASEMPIEKLKQPDSEIPFPHLFSYVPWMHHVLIIQKCKSMDEALFYIRKTIERNWSRSALDDCIRAGLYRVSGSALTNFNEQLPVPQGQLAQDLIKETYDLGFIALPEGYDETALEDALEQRMTRFLLELGEGWAFVGRQKEIIVAGKTRRIDLLFYHIYLRCYVVIELKVKSFEPEFAGKLNFYVNAVDDLIRRDGDNPTIGLLICKDMEHTEVQYAFQGVTTPMGVAKYDNVRIREIQNLLPSTEQIKAVMAQAEEDFMREQQSK
ncbi:MAG: DUF1016 family protein [Clostridia bacterium]|nr:DUF1016 family protein [Clostridia bacterium]